MIRTQKIIMKICQNKEKRFIPYPLQYDAYSLPAFLLKQKLLLPF